MHFENEINKTLKSVAHPDGYDHHKHNHFDRIDYIQCKILKKNNFNLERRTRTKTEKKNYLKVKAVTRIKSYSFCL